MAAETGPSSSSLLWTYIRAITQFRRNGKTANISRGRNRQKWSYSHADSFIYKYTTRNFGEVSEDSDCEHTDSELEADSVDKEGDYLSDSGPTWRIFVIKPDGRFIHYWLFFVTSAVLYYLWFLVARDTWLRHGPNYMTTVWTTLDTIFDTIYVVDIVIQFRTGYLEHGILVTDGKLLAKRYIKTIYFLCDVISLFPLYLICFIVGIEPPALLKCPRFLKIYRARQFSSKVESAASHPNGVRIFNLVHFLFLLTHWFAAVYFYVSGMVGFGIGKWVHPNTTNTGDYSDISRQYLTSFYWSTITLTTIGDIPRPESNLELVIQILGYMLGVFVFATIVGQVGTVVENRNSLRLSFERHVDNAKRYMREHKVPHEVQKPILRWYEYAWTRGQMTGRGDVNSLGLLPTKLRTELALHVNLKTLKKVSFFKRCQPEFLHDLVLKMQLNIITPGELFCRKGEVARDVFIVSDGFLEVIGKRGRVIRKLETGDFFGEIRTMVCEEGSNRRAVDVRSVGYSELFTISKGDIIGLLKDHPQAKNVLEETSRSYDFNRSKRRKRSSRRIPERQSRAIMEEENEMADTTAEMNNSQETKAEANATPDTLLVPNEGETVRLRPAHKGETVRLRPAESFRSKQKKIENRHSLRFIPEGTTRRKRSIYRRISGDISATDAAAAGLVARKLGTKRVTFGGTATRVESSVVEIPTDISNIVEHKMDHIGDDVKKLLAYTRQLEEKLQLLTQEKESLEDEIADLMESKQASVDNDDETNV